MKGGRETLLNQIFGIEIEVEFAEIYENQLLFADVDKFIRKLGFYLFDIQGQYWKRKSQIVNYGKKGQLIWGNALYLKKTDYFRKMIENINETDLKKSRVLNAISICLLYGYVDYALEIFNTNNIIFDKDESTMIAKKLGGATSIGNRIPFIKGKGRLANLFYYLGDIFSVDNNSWSNADKVLGNR